MAVVWDSIIESEVPATTTFGSYGKHDSGSHRDVHHHHFLHHPAGHPKLSQFAGAFHHKPHANRDLVSWTPDSDVRETKLAYHIEMELPGVSEKKDVLIQWMLPRTLLVEGKAMRPDLNRGREADGDAMWESDMVSDSNGHSNGHSEKSKSDKPETSTNEDGGPCTRIADTETEQTTKLVHSERKLGEWRRIFTLPLDADMQNVKAGLDSGLLHISIFKKKMCGDHEVVTIQVQ